MKKIETTWELRSYDVWGNSKDGWDVNDCYSRGSVDIELNVVTYNVGTPNEFQSASPTATDIRRVFGLTNVQIDTDGDDLRLYVNRERDGYPLGEMRCTSHSSLSPIKANASEDDKIEKRDGWSRGDAE